MPSQKSHTLDSANTVGFWLSVGCVIHCVSVPVLLVLLPYSLLDSLADPRVHQILAVSGLIFGLGSLIPGWVRHRKHSILALGAVGLMLINLGAFQLDCCTAWTAVEASDAALTPAQTTVSAGWSFVSIWSTLLSNMTIIGGVLLAISHFANHEALHQATVQEALSRTCPDNKPQMTGNKACC